MGIIEHTHKLISDIDDRGDITVEKIEGGDVFISLHGACVTCPKSELTMKHGIEKTLRDKIANITSVQQLGKVIVDV
jgi:Fe-S cluster biogenesis protein NfuA